MKRNIVFRTWESLSRMSVTKFSMHEATIHLNREVIMLIEFYVLPLWIFAPESTAQLQRRLKHEATCHRQKRKTRGQAGTAAPLEDSLLQRWCCIPHFVDRVLYKVFIYSYINLWLNWHQNKWVYICLSAIGQIFVGFKHVWTNLIKPWSCSVQLHVFWAIQPCL